MTTTTIKLRTLRRKKTDPIPEINYSFGADLAESTQLFGAETIHALFVQAARAQLSEFARKVMTRKKDPLSLAQLQEGLDDRSVFHPEVKRRGKSPLDKAEAMLADMTPEERAKLVEIAKTFAATPQPATQPQTSVVPEPSAKSVTTPPPAKA